MLEAVIQTLVGHRWKVKNFCCTEFTWVNGKSYMDVEEDRNQTVKDTESCKWQEGTHLA